MKKIFLILIFAVFSTALIAENGYGDFVVTKEGVFYFKNVRHGITIFLVCKKANGEKVKFTKSDVLVYQLKGQRYEKMKVYKNCELSNDCAFMRVLTYKNGMKLCEHLTYYDSGKIIPNYFVYKGGDLIVDVNEKNYESIRQFYKGEYSEN